MIILYVIVKSKAIRYAYTTGELGEAVDTKTWSYGNSTWSDLLTSHNGEQIVYDEIGNPLTIGNKELTWLGRQLLGITEGESTVSYTYNGDGQRTSKTVNGVNTEYIYNGEILAGQKTGNDIIVFMYDNNSDAFGFIYNSTEYYYIKNAQNDVTAIADSNGNVLARYYYDAWGKVLEITGNTEIAGLNPIRYRSYYYDKETEWYYLSSRYYNADACRFINSDNYALPTATPTELTDKNLFAYCDNNPINRVDDEGDLWTYAGLIAASAFVGGTICATISAITQYKDTGSVNWTVVGVNALSGAISGGLAMTSIGLPTSIAINAALGGGTYIAEQMIKGEKIDIIDTAISTVAGAIGGVIGGKGTDGKVLVQTWNSAKNGITREFRRKNTKYAAKQIGRYLIRKKGVKNALKYTLKRFVFGSATNTFSSRRLKILRRRTN